MALRALLGKVGFPLRAAGSNSALPKDLSKRSRKLIDPTKFDSVGSQARAISARINEEMKCDWEKVEKRTKLYNRLNMAAAGFGFTSALLVGSLLAKTILED